MFIAILTLPILRLIQMYMESYEKYKKYIFWYHYYVYINLTKVIFCNIYFFNRVFN